MDTLKTVAPNHRLGAGLSRAKKRADGQVERHQDDG
jgi:hypothetical protein